jgi:hypothetical protein
LNHDWERSDSNKAKVSGDDNMNKPPPKRMKTRRTAD